MKLQVMLAAVALTMFGLPARAGESPAPVQKMSAAEIADKNVAARGGLAAWRAVATLSIRGKMDAGGNERSTLPMQGHRTAKNMPPARPQTQSQLPFAMELKRPHKTRVEVEFRGQTAVQVYDGVNGWKLRPFLGRKQVEPFTPEELSSASFDDELDGPLVDYQRKGATIQMESVEKVEGRDAYKLKVTSKDNRVRHIWIDAQSFLEVKMDGVPRRLDGKLRPVEVYLRDYRNLNGLMVPYTVETEVVGYRPFHKMTIDVVTVNQKLDDLLFAKPVVK